MIWKASQNVDDPRTPWEIDIQRFAHETGKPLDECRDIIIWQWLRLGDARPLEESLLKGYVPGPTLRHYLGRMLRCDPDLPYSLLIEKQNKAHRRKLSWRSTAENETRDRLVAENVHSLIPKMGYAPAIQHIAKFAGIGEDTIKKAYDRRYGKKVRKSFP
jgi:hypothetical protein